MSSDEDRVCSPQERAMDEFIVRFTPHFLTLPERLDEVVAALRADDPAQEVARAFDCGVDVAEHLLSTQLRRLSPQSLAEYREEYESALRRLRKHVAAE
ncbi:hypothetical protein [Brachybacterium sp. ACRRE]|uniref:hypothetical protein n=1 Tax=Brachybacterium sp. ACRRE TaxID=2918184 RepID=UPI001EF1B01F|nr:hypothetical protein [Brachybacterium sp. ACRRE]MCG7311392.1 hypothetical protein [Brachybacterium sp. ACRRE]